MGTIISEDNCAYSNGPSEGPGRSSSGYVLQRKGTTFQKGYGILYGEEVYDAEIFDATIAIRAAFVAEFRWVPELSNILGNEEADTDARTALRNLPERQTQHSYLTLAFPRRLIQQRRQQLVEKWWSNKAPDLALSRRLLHELIAARTGHGDFVAYHCRIHHVDTDQECVCGRETTPAHFFYCRQHANQVRKFRNGMIWIPSENIFLGMIALRILKICTVYRLLQWPNFMNIDKPIFRKIRDHLRMNGVYVVKEKRFKIAKALAQVAIEDDSAIWSEENIREQLEKEGKFNSHRNKISSYSKSTYPPIEKPSTGRELTDFSKCYNTDMKYGGSDDRFDYKLSIFYDVCNRIQPPEWQWKSAISIMLKSRALVFFYRTLLPKITTEMTFHQVITSIRNNFEGESYKRLVQQQWRKVSLSSVIEENPDKSMSEHLETLIETPQDLQLGLDSKYRDDHLRDKLIQACEGNSTFQNACYRPALSLEKFINDLRSSVLAHERSLNPNSTSLFTERRF
ncbi:hypothetical protein EPUL_003334 [Erysiphe pulchra]|uniref:Uncharacterized protein n=1 Tax=Erysiphe pulchra TaxID=225359 RepID=A0A2S4PYV5_9PEZI|nr:hypothetical protein EPUL_003334 [Erysiphe pulchra]